MPMLGETVSCIDGARVFESNRKEMNISLRNLSKGMAAPKSFPMAEKSVNGRVSAEKCWG